MKISKIIFLFIAVLSFGLIAHTRIKIASAQGTFTCANPAFTSNCEVGLNSCDTGNGYQTLLDNGKRCEDFSGSDCPTGFHPCQLPPSPTPTPTPPPIPTCKSPNSCQRGGCTNGAVQISGQCVNKEDVCCTPNSQDCYNDCLSRGDTPSECKGSCGIPLPENGGSSGNREAAMVNLDQLIQQLTNMSQNGRFGKLTTLGGILTGLLPFLYGIAGVGLLLFLIAGGFGYLTSSGDPKKMEAAKGQITNAVIGFILVIVAFWLTGIVNFIFNLGTTLK